MGEGGGVTIPTMKSYLTWLLTLGGAESCGLDGRSSMSNGGRFEGSMAAGFSIESDKEWYAEDKCRGVIMEPIPGNNNNNNSLLELLV